LNAALGIYRETILPEAQNPERQILYWIDHGKDDLTDEFRCFAILTGNLVTGYLQYSFFREENIFFFEYLCLRDPSRKALVPSEALKVIEDYLSQNYLPNFTIVFEVARKRNEGGAWEPDTKLIKYFKRLGFRTVEFEYRYPILQSYDGQSSYPADLMIRLPEKRTTVLSSEMRTILRCIYFKHYLRWDRPFLEAPRFAERERLINELYSSQVVRIRSDDSFNTDGDDKRSQLLRFVRHPVQIRQLLEKIFGPKLPRLLIIIVVLLVTQRLIANDWLLVPFTLAAALIYCLAEDTEASRKLIVVIVSKLSLFRTRQL